MSVNQNLIGKGLKQLLVLILLLIVSPIYLNIAFKALNKFEANDIWIAYLLLGVSAILIIVTITLAFKAFQTLLDGLFNSKEQN